MRLFLSKHDFPIPKYRIYNHKDFGFFFKELEKLSGPLALDLETSGLDPFLPESYIRSVSISGSTDECMALDLKDLPDRVKARFWDWASSYQSGFVMHNAVFDATWCQLHGKKVKVHRCTSVMFRNVCNEGYPGQKWGLKVAMEEILGWSEVNTYKLDNWLEENKLGKGGMCKAPWAILGPYNALDAGATYQLYSHITSSIISNHNFNAIEDYWNNEIADMIDVIIEQYIHGLYVDMNGLRKSLEELTLEVEAKCNKFLSQPTIAHHIEEYNRQFIERMSVNKHSQYTSKGEVNLNWEKHNKKVEALKTQQHFNLNSNDHLKWLFFDRLKKQPVRFVEQKKDGRKIKTNNPSVDKKALPLLGEETRPLLDYRKSRGVLEDLQSIENTQIDGVLHPFLTIAGTVTGRLAGSYKDGDSRKFNIQNIVNDKRVYNCLVAPEGWKIIYMDFASLEPHVLCEFSKDARLRALYLEGKPHDLYLWFGANTTLFGPMLKDYPNTNPTKEIIKELKKKHHELRKALKIIVLGLGYNMGEKKLMEDVNDQTDLTITIRDARRIKHEYFRFFPGVTRFIEKLDQLYIQNDEKYIINGRGRPLFTLMDDRSKLCNKFIQSTGHDITQIMISRIYNNRKNLPFKLIPYDVDKHDSTAWIFPDTKENEELAVKVYKQSLQELNEMIPWEVKMSGEIKTGRRLGDFLDV